MLKKIWYHLEEFILLPILVFQLCLIFVNVIMRYCFASAIPWAEELARYTFVWLMWFGVSYAARNKSHLRITMLRDALPAKGSYWLEFFVTIVWLVFGVIVVILGIRMTQSIIQYKQVSAALQLPMQYAYVGVPIGSGLMCLRLLETLYKDYFSRLIGKKSSKEDQDK